MNIENVAPNIGVDAIIEKQKSTIVYNVVSPNKIELLYNNLPISAGLTIANSLRRCILAFSQGYAITAIRITGVDHAFAPIAGVNEDYINVILNIRGLIIKADPMPSINEWIKIKLTGPMEIRGEHFNIPGKVEILNQKHRICNLSNYNTLELEFLITHGTGFVMMQEHKENMNANPESYGYNNFDKAIFLDTNFSPVKSVTYNISEPFNKREDMSLLVETNGATSAENIINNAVENLILLYKNINPNLKLDKSDEHEHTYHDSGNDDILSLKVDDPTLALSKRSINGLMRQSIYTLGDLAKHNEAEIINFQNIGKNSANEIKAMMKTKGINFAIQES